MLPLLKRIDRMKFKINYTRKNGKRSSFDFGAGDPIEALEKLVKNRANYGEELSDINNINIRKL